MQYYFLLRIHSRTNEDSKVSALDTMMHTYTPPTYSTQAGRYKIIHNHDHIVTTIYITTNGNTQTLFTAGACCGMEGGGAIAAGAY